MMALILVADGFDDLQLYLPWYRLLEEGVTVKIATPSGHKATGLHGYRVEADMPIGAGRGGGGGGGGAPPAGGPPPGGRPPRRSTSDPLLPHPPAQHLRDHD